MNKRVTAKERGLLKGSIRRVFARSELRLKILDASEIKHSDPKRPRVKRWCRCNVCKQPSARYSTAVDHIDPVVAVGSSFEEQGLDVTVDRTWCEETNLQSICEACHAAKSKHERAERKRSKKK